MNKEQIATIDRLIQHLTSVHNIAEEIVAELPEEDRDRTTLLNALRHVTEARGYLRCAYWLNVEEAYNKIT